MTDLDRVIHEPARLLIVALLAGVKEADFLWVQRESGLTKGNLSSHLSKLEEAGYVTIEKSFLDRKPLTRARITSAGIKAFRRYLDAMTTLVRPTSKR